MLKKIFFVNRQKTLDFTENIVYNSSKGAYCLVLLPIGAKITVFSERRVDLYAGTAIITQPRRSGTS